MAALLIAALWISAAIASPLLDLTPCAEGPTFWCQNIRRASECGAVQHCVQTAWKQPTVKGPVCDLCKDVVGVVGSLLKENATEKEMLDYLDKACKMLPSPDLTKECEALVDDYLPVILNILKGELENPEVVCSALGLCKSLQKELHHKEILSNEIPEVALPAEVDMAKLTAPFIANIPLLLYPQENIKPKSSDDLCHDCIDFVTKVQVAVKLNRSVADDIINEISKQCSTLGTELRDLCKEYISMYAPEVLRALMQMEPKNICEKCGFCEEPATVPMLLLQKAKVLQPVRTNMMQPKLSPQCAICEFALRELGSFLDQNKTEEAITKGVEVVCSLLPATLKAECQAFVDQYGKAVIQLIMEEMSPDLVCTFLGLCLGSDHNVVEKINPKELEAGPLCEVCKIVMQDIINLLETNATEAEIEAALDKVCNLLPEGIRDECDQLVAQYGSAILQMLMQVFDPDFVCIKIGVCETGKPRLLGQEHCVWGPSYWCKDMESARECNAVEHCTRHVWN
uniref:Proactivator polypeptide-like protein n=1 Tax=Callorhinchus milii TaxID=7868 RepID=V9KI50_CALMI